MSRKALAVSFGFLACALSFVAGWAVGTFPEHVPGLWVFLGLEIFFATIAFVGSLAD